MTAAGNAAPHQLTPASEDEVVDAVVSVTGGSDGAAATSPAEEPIRVGVLTSGGDAQGMNAAVRAAVRTLLRLGAQAQ